MSELNADSIQREIENKKKKLEELRQRRQQRQQQSIINEEINLTPTAQTTATTTPMNVTVTPQDTDNILNVVNSLISSTPTVTITSPSAASISTPVPLSSESAASSVKSTKSFTTQTQASITIPPVDRINYDVQIQTDDVESKLKESGEWNEEMEAIVSERDSLRNRELELLKVISDMKAQQIKQQQEALEAEHRTLDSVQQEAILSSEEFHHFFTRTSTMMERLLGVETELKQRPELNYDFTIDYHSDIADSKEGNNKAEEKLICKYVFQDSKLIGRPCTSIHWSSKFTELLLSSYASDDNEVTSNEPDGTVLVWNLHMKKRAEYNFTCQSSIHTAMFHTGHPKLILGGCENGQLVIWDMRTTKQTPVNRTSLSHGHTHPIFALNIVQLPSGLYNIVSVSSDGHVCVWNESNLHKPIHDVTLHTMGHATKEDITTTCFDFNGRDINTLLLGSDEGNIYKSKIYETKDQVYETIKGHDAPVTNIEFHPMYRYGSPLCAPPSSPASDLYLTSSYDWTVKLWSQRLAKPIHTFELRDYVYDCRWCPTNPSIFVSADGTGQIDLWNINSDMEVPMYSVNSGREESSSSVPVSSDSNVDTSALRPTTAISKVRWNDAGSMLASGTSNGTLNVYEVSSDIWQPDRDEVSRFYELIGKKAVASQLE